MKFDRRDNTCVHVHVRQCNIFLPDIVSERETFQLDIETFWPDIVRCPTTISGPVGGYMSCILVLTPPPLPSRPYCNSALSCFVFYIFLFNFSFLICFSDFFLLFFSSFFFFLYSLYFTFFSFSVCFYFFSISFFSFLIVLLIFFFSFFQSIFPLFSFFFS